MAYLRSKKQSDGIPCVEKKKKATVEVKRETLKSAAKERSRENDGILQRILNFFKRDKRYSEIVIDGVLDHKRVALLVDGLLEHFEMDTLDNQDLHGAIFKGKIQNLEAGLKAAFVDIGQEKNAFLHYWDVLPLLNGEGFNENNNDESVEVINRDDNSNDRERVLTADVPAKIPVGTDILVQVTKSQIGSKGPRVTTNITLPGRYVVLTPHSRQCGISRKIDHKRDRDRLRKLLDKLTLPEGMGVIFRTSCADASVKQITRDLQFLLDAWQTVQQKAAAAERPCMVYHEPNLLERTVRDFLTDDVDRVLIDSEADYEFLREKLERLAPNLRKKIVFYKEPIPIFERYGVELQLEQMFSQRVPLPSGGEIVIQETEALTSVDVNTSSHKMNEADQSQFIFQANLEAAREVARQVRLRNIGGIIIVDFVDMRQPKSRRLLHEFLEKEFESDTARVQVFPVTQLGLIQISRQRHKESLRSQLYSCCPYCNGEGRLQSSRNLSLQIQRELFRQCRATNGGDFTVILNPYLKSYLLANCLSEFSALEAQQAIKVNFAADPNVHVENFKVVRNG